MRLAELLPGVQMEATRQQILAWLDNMAPTGAFNATEQQLNFLLEIVPVAILYLDTKLTVRFANRIYLRRVGKSASEVLGCALQDVMGVESFARFEAGLRRALRGEDISFEVTLRDPTRGERNLRLQTVPHVDESRNVIGVVAAIEDVTEGTESEERFRRFAEFSPDGLWFADAATLNFEYLSPALDKIWGVDRREVLGPPDRWLELRHVDDRAQAQAHLDLLAAGRENIAEHRIVRPNDSAVRWIRDYGFPIHGADGQVQRVAGISRDITDEKDAADRLAASEEQLRLVIENAREFAIFTLDLKRCVTMWNSGAERLLGYTFHEIVGQLADRLFTAQDNATGEPEKEAQTAIRDGRAGDERWHVRKDGRLLWSSGYMMPLRGRDGVLRGFLKILHDRTEAKRVEEAMQRERARELAELARKEVVQNLANAQEDERRRISRELHDEVGQHITALLLGLNELAERLPGGEQLDRLHQLQSLASLVGEEVHRVATQLRPTSLDDLGLVRSLSTFVSMWAKRARLRADFHALGFDETRLPAPIETAIYRIVQESLNNILKHAQATTVSVILEKNRREVTALIEDDGVGFDLSAAEQAETVRRLGLLGMKERASLVGGILRIESGPGQGTTVSVRVPLANS